MVAEYVIGTITATGGVIASLFGGGLLTRYIKHSNDLAVARHIIDNTTAKVETLQAEVATLKSDSAVINSKIEEFSRHIVKLDLIPDLAAKLDATKSVVETMSELVAAIAAERSQSSTPAKRKRRAESQAR